MKRLVKYVAMESAARALVTAIVGETFELERAVARQIAARLIVALDKAGLVIMPAEPTSDMVQASMVAMRSTRTIGGSSPDRIQAVKHTIRYRAIVEMQRGQLSLAKNTRPAAAKRSRKRVLGARDGKYTKHRPLTSFEIT
ncbi:hypothetical protein [Lichenicola sp.]|uniref:hypothetical protein n=1 Tax=Lichenicola sp. TaxID=2804529 RepID=UPI003B009F72